jgi:hypothetical protein
VVTGHLIESAACCGVVGSGKETLPRVCKGKRMYGRQRVWAIVWERKVRNIGVGEGQGDKGVHGRPHVPNDRIIERTVQIKADRADAIERAGRPEKKTRSPPSLSLAGRRMQTAVVHKAQNKFLK